jgi:hypothetical protein
MADAATTATAADRERRADVLDRDTIRNLLTES